MLLSKAAAELNPTVIQPELQVEVLSTFEAEYSSVNNSTIVYFEDGIDSRFFDNGTERHFTQNITGPPIYMKNGTIYHVSNGSEVFLD